MNFDMICDLNKEELKTVIIELQKDIALLEYKIERLSKDKILKQNTVLKLKRIMEEKC